jgi:pimeloyl-ACP methyl ester carboxylesterase
MKLYYRKYGSGPSLIILHGLYGSSDNWVTIAKELGNTFTVYLPDQRNHGQSAHSDTHDYDSMRDDLYELASDLKLKKFFLAGHSMGGKTAISFAIRWPEMINGLVIADISPFTNENFRLSAYNEHFSILKAILSIDLTTISSRGDAESVLSETIHSDKVRGFILKNLLRTSGNNFRWKLNASSLLNNLDNIMEGVDHRQTNNQHITGFPVIFLKGSESDHLPEKDYKDISKIFPAAEFIEVTNAGHWIHGDRPDEVIRYILKLLTYS